MPWAHQEGRQLGDCEHRHVPAPLQPVVPCHLHPVAQDSGGPEGVGSGVWPGSSYGQQPPASPRCRRNSVLYVCCVRRDKDDAILGCWGEMNLFCADKKKVV